MPFKKAGLFISAATSALTPIILSTSNNVPYWTRDKIFSCVSWGTFNIFVEGCRKSSTDASFAIGNVLLVGGFQFLNGATLRMIEWNDAVENYCGVNGAYSNTTNCIDIKHEYNHDDLNVLQFAVNTTLIACETAIVLQSGYQIGKLIANNLGFFLQRAPQPVQVSADVERQLPEQSEESSSLLIPQN